MTLRIVQQGSGNPRPLLLVYHLNARNDDALKASAGSNALIVNDTTVGSDYSSTPPLAQTLSTLSAAVGASLSPVLVAGFSAGGLATRRILAQGGDPDALVIADGTYGSVPSQWTDWQRYAQRAESGQRIFITSNTSLLGTTSTWHVLSAIVGFDLPLGASIAGRPADAPVISGSGPARYQKGNFVIYSYPTNDTPGHQYQGDSVLPMMLREAFGKISTPSSWPWTTVAVAALSVAAVGGLAYVLLSRPQHLQSPELVVGEDLAHRDLERIIDTRTWEGSLPGVGDIDSGELVTYHVTDNPKRALEVIARNRLLSGYGPSGRHAELGPGLYTSGVPEYWVGRAGGKWSFLSRLTDLEIERLTDALQARIEEQWRTHYITESEHEIALREIRYVRTKAYVNASPLLRLADQPYNIGFWKPSFLRPLGIEPGALPRVLELRLVGQFAELGRSHPDPQLLRHLRRLGVSGVFTRSSFATNPELVLWDARAIVSVREVTLRRT